MTRVLLVGLDPQTVDFSDPSLPPGLDAATIRAGLDATLGDMRSRGWTVDHCSVKPDASAVAALRARLDANAYDCVVVGGGVRVPPKNLLLFEALVDTIHRHAPNAAIAFNTRPEDSVEAVERRLRA